MSINLDHVFKMDQIKDTTTLFDLKEILRILVNAKMERGLSITEIKNASRMSDARIRPSILLLNVLEFITISDKIGNTVLYIINPKGLNFLKELEIYEREV